MFHMLAILFWLWSTEAAEVPGLEQMTLLVNGTNCTLREPLYNHTFDFHALSSDLQHHVTSDDESDERFFFNVCGGAPGASGAYLKHAGKNVSLGQDARLQLTDGRIQFRFEGDPCGTNNGSAKPGVIASRYSLDIILICRYVHQPDELRVLPHTTDSCRYFIFWDTPLACLPLPAAVRNNSCSVQDGAHLYSLLELGRENHEVPVGSGGSRFILSVCKPVNYGHDAMCPPGSSVCFVNETISDRALRYRDFGQAVANPTIDAQGRLVMNMRTPTGNNCEQSRIVFECGAGQSDVQYLGNSSCTHEFLWRTELACRNASRSCAIGTIVDLNPLANRTYAVTVGGDNRTYELAVCRTPSSSFHCGSEWGACETLYNNTQTVGLGRLNDELIFDKNPYLQYPSGAECDPAKNRRWETRIEFICENDRLEPLVVVAENNDCLLVVHIVTAYACHAQLECGAYNVSSPDQYVDLSPLVRSSANYEARIGAGLPATHRYFLNVCRPLVPQYGLSCRGGAAACETIFDGTTQRNETTLGFPEVQPVVAGDTVLLKYFLGDPCPQDHHTNLSTTITFRCAPSVGSGEPMLVEIEHDCHYRFEWATAVICPNVGMALPSTGLPFSANNCSFYNPTTAAWANMNKIFLGTEIGELCDRNPVAYIDDRTPAGAGAALAVYFTTYIDDLHANGCTDSIGKRSYNISVTCGHDSPLVRTAVSTV